MNRKEYRDRSTQAKWVALFLLVVMTTLLVGKSVHICIHAIHTCESSAHSDHEHHHDDCKICNFELPLFDKAEIPVIRCILCIVSSVEVAYIHKKHSVNLIAHSTRAPPATII